MKQDKKIKQHKVEIIATSLADIIELNKVKAPIEIELCGAMDADGLTPDLALAVACIQQSNHPIRVMIRNHNNGFYYTEQELQVMVEQIQFIVEQANPAGFVFGCLNQDHTQIDFQAMEQLIAATKGRSNTFHKAIDYIIAKLDVNQLHRLKIKRILTQGGRGPLEDNIKVVEKLATPDLDVLVGGGVNLNNFTRFVNLTHHIHVGKAVRLNNSYDHGYDYAAINLITQ